MVESFRISGLKERAKITPQQRAEGLRQFTQAAFISPGVVRGKPMGFFGNVFRGITGAIKGFLGVPARAAPAARFVGGRAAAQPTRRALARLGGAAALGGAFAGGDLAVGALAGGGDIGGDGGVGGNGRTFRRTIIQTIDSDSGEVLKQRVRRGSPFLMRTDVIVAKRVFRMATKLHGKLPRRTVRQSRVKALTDRVVESALDRAACPTSDK